MSFAFLGGIIGFGLASNSTANKQIPDNTITLNVNSSQTPTLIDTGIPIAKSTYDPLISCNGHTISKSPIFSFPNESARYELLEPSTPVEVIGQAQDRAWYKVNSIHSGWMKPDHIVLNNCTPNTYKISYLLGFDPSQEELLLEETFSRGWQNWESNNIDNVEINTSASGDYQLSLNGKDELILVESKKLSEVDKFNLITSFERVDMKIDSFAGIRLINEQNEILEIRITHNCAIKILTYDKFLNPLPLADSQADCPIHNNEYWVISYESPNGFRVIINDSYESRFYVPFSGNLHIQLEAQNALVKFNFLVVTASHGH